MWDNQAMKSLLIGLSFILLILVVGLTSFFLYKNTDVDRQITKLEGQIQNFLALEDEIFTNCLDGKLNTPENQELCEINTQQQLRILTSEAVAEKQRLESLSISEIFNY